MTFGLIRYVNRNDINPVRSIRDTEVIPSLLWFVVLPFIGYVGARILIMIAAWRRLP